MIGHRRGLSCGSACACNHSMDMAAPDPATQQQSVPSEVVVSPSLPILSWDICFLDETPPCSMADDVFFSSSGYVQVQDGDLLLNEGGDLDIHDDDGIPIQSLASVEESNHVHLVRSPTMKIDSAIFALHGLESSIASLCSSPKHVVSGEEFYTKLRDNNPELSTTRAHLDGGAMASTTDKRGLIWDLRPVDTEPPTLRVADGNPHVPTHQGFLALPIDDATINNCLLVPVYYTPSLPATIVSPDSARAHFGCQGHTTVSRINTDDCYVRLEDCDPTKATSNSFTIPVTLVHGLLFSRPLIRPTTASPDDSILPNLPISHRGIYQVRSAFEYALWHQRLGHIHSRRVRDLHHVVDGIPKGLPMPSEIDRCPICAKAKLRYANRTQNSTNRTTQVYQGLSLDFGFVVQASSKDSDRLRRQQGLYGETCYCLIVDHFSGRLWGRCFQSKAPPIEYLTEWLAQYALPNTVPDKYVRFDLGGDLGGCKAVVDLFTNAGYQFDPTAPYSSSTNGLGERPHQTIADAMRAMLAGAELDAKFWPYAFHHFLRLYNLTPHGTREKSPHELCTGRRPNLHLLRTFGCRVYALPHRPNRRRPDKLLSDARTGIFLGFTTTMRHALYYDIVSERVKECQHLVYDEGFNDADIKPPNARFLHGLKNGDNGTPIPPDLHDLSEQVPDIAVETSPFTQLRTITVPLDLGSDRPTGLGVGQCNRMHRAYVTDIGTVPVKVDGRLITTAKARRQFRGSYFFSIAGRPVYSDADVQRVFDELDRMEKPLETVDIILAPDWKTDFDKRTPPLHLRVNQLCSIAALKLESGEDLSHREYQTAVKVAAETMRMELGIQSIRVGEESSVILLAIDSSGRSRSAIPSSFGINKLQTDGMTNEERALPAFTRKRLQKLTNWPQWDAAFDKQLEAHHTSTVLGEPILLESIPEEERKNVLRLVWSNSVKPDGTRKARACLDGSKRAAPWLRAFVKTYAASLSYPGLRLFSALCAIHGLVVVYGDTENAFQQSPPPVKKCYVMIDEAYQSWYTKKHGRILDWGKYVIPLQRALQGHPEAGVLWADKINSIIIDDLGLQPTVQEPTLYTGVFEGKTILMARQVDDYAIGAPDIETGERLIAMINSKVGTVSKGAGTVVEGKGLYYRYDGVDIQQTRYYIKLSAESYIERVLLSHGWDKPSPRESDSYEKAALQPETTTPLQTMVGPSEGTVEHRTLEKSMGFSYRQLMGELMYAYVTCRLDIGFAVTFLSKFSGAPHENHYQALKGVCKYLRRNLSWGLIYHRGDRPIMSLPVGNFKFLDEDDSLPPFPPAELNVLTAYVDAAHATDMKTRRSVTGCGIVLANAAVSYKTKLQPVVATSSTEAEFVAAVAAAKDVKHLRSILLGLGHPCLEPTKLLMDNQAAIAMINDQRPTQRSRHIDIQHFAIQEWRAAKEIIMDHIPGIINPADAATKAVGCFLHQRHTRRLMGHYKPITMK